MECTLNIDVSIYYRVYFPTTTRLVQRGKARVPERTSLQSFNLLWLMWAVCGGFFITNFILSNWLPTLVKPIFEQPVETAQVWNWILIFLETFNLKIKILACKFSNANFEFMVAPSQETLIPPLFPQIPPQIKNVNFDFFCKFCVTPWNNGETLITYI